MASDRSSRPNSLPPGPSRRSSRASQRDSSAYAPMTPSRLARSFAPGTSPEEPQQQFQTPASQFPPRSRPQSPPMGARRGSPSSPPLSPTRAPQNATPNTTTPTLRSPSASPPRIAASAAAHTLPPPAPLNGADDDAAGDRARLLSAYRLTDAPACGLPRGSCDHGSFLPSSQPPDGGDGFGGRYPGSVNAGQDGLQGVLGEALPDMFGYGDRASIRSVLSGPDMDASSQITAGESVTETPGSLENGGTRRRKHRVTKGLSTTQWLARTHGITGRRRMYLNYYFPFTYWIRQYRLSWLMGDVVAALTMASFYIPMALSYADNLGHLPPINGLYSFVFNPIIYALLGTCPQMVVGPEAAGSLLVGSVVRSSVDKGTSHDLDAVVHARIAGVVTGMAGAVIFIAGLTRLGFLDSVLSRPFLRGFISAIGVVIFIDQLVPEMGLVKAEHGAQVDHGSSWDKIVFIVQNIRKAHGLTCAVSFGSFVIIMVCREVKKRLQPRRPAVAYVPDRFIIVVLSAVLTYAFRWDQRGLDILGEVKSSTGSPFTFHWPFIPAHMTHVREAMGTSFLIALLGFFESSVAAKALGEGSGRPEDGITGLAPSANRELVALGFANLVGGCFMALPAFGGYGRSKVNVSTGGRTPMSSILLSLITLLVVLFFLPYLYYLPKGVLSAMVSVVAWSLVEECPHDIRFFVHVRGWAELFLMFAIFAATIFYSLPLGIALGIGLSLLSVVKHATKPRIQILGRVPGEDRFENAESNPQALEFVEGCLIVKIPEPLTFANTGDLKARLRKLEKYGTTSAHPALPRVRAPENNANVIFDVHGVTSLDGSGAQVLTEIVTGYVGRGARVFFCRVPPPDSPVFDRFRRSGILDVCGGEAHFVRSVDEALRLASKEDEDERYRDEV